MIPGTLTPAIFGVSAHVAPKLRKTRLFIYILCIFIDSQFFCISKNWMQREMSLAPLILKEPDMTDTSRDSGLLCLALVYTESHKARKHDVASA